MKVPLMYTDQADAAESTLVQRALNQVETEVYNTEFAPLEGMKYVPVDDSFDEGAMSTSYRMYTRTGIAKLVTGRGKDLPTVGAFVQEFNHKFYDIGACYRYSLRDLLAASFSNRNGYPTVSIDMTQAEAARAAIDRGLDVITALGSATSATIPGLSVGIGPDIGLLGLLNNPNASTYTPATGASGSATWALKTPDEILADLHGMCRSVISATYKVEQINRILLPIDQHQIIMSVRMGDGSDESILSLFQKQRPGVLVDSWQYCDTAGTGGTDRAVGFNSDRRKIKLALSVRFKQLPTEYRNREFKTDCIARTAGVFAIKPLSVVYMDGI